MSIDHGVLNVPLRKRGNIDAQIDKHKAAMRKAKNQRMHEINRNYAALVAEARELVALVSDARMAELGKPHGLTARKCRQEWVLIARRAPGTVIACMRKELEAQP